jgi:hypothetical protein
MKRGSGGLLVAPPLSHARWSYYSVGTKTCDARFQPITALWIYSCVMLGWYDDTALACGGIEMALPKRWYSTRRVTVTSPYHLPTQNTKHVRSAVCALCAGPVRPHGGHFCCLLTCMQGTTGALGSPQLRRTRPVRTRLARDKMWPPQLSSPATLPNSCPKLLRGQFKGPASTQRYRILMWLGVWCSFPADAVMLTEALSLLGPDCDGTLFECHLAALDLLRQERTEVRMTPKGAQLLKYFMVRCVCARSASAV